MKTVPLYEFPNVRPKRRGVWSEMTETADASRDPLWVDGDMMFRVAGTAAEPDRLIKPRRPFAIVGRIGDNDIVVDDRAVSARHVYLHLDRRGVYAVDLVTRTGMRINGVSQVVGWIRPGDWIEIAGRKIELVRIRFNGINFEPPPCDEDLLADTGLSDLPGLTLEPRRSADSPWVLGSELVFLGWSASCGIQIKDSAVSRTHCAIVRAARGAFLVDLCGKQTWVEDHPVTGATPIHDGDLITLGSTQFTVRVEKSPRTTQINHNTQIPQNTQLERITNLPKPIIEHRELMPAFQANTDLSAPDAQASFIAWMMGAIQGGQGELLRRQGEFQVSMTQMLQQIQRDQASLLTAQLERIESIDNELAALRAEIERRNAGPTRPAPPDVAPLRIARPAPNTQPTPESKASTNWLLNRVNQLEDENKSAWKDLLGRLSQSRKVP